MAGTDNDNDRHWVTVREAARRLSKSERTIRRWIAKDDIPVDRTTPVMRVDIAGRGDDTDVTTPVSDVTTPGADPDELTATIERLEAEAEALRAKVDRLADDNRDLEADNGRLRDLLDQAQNERDYLRQAHAMSLSQSQKLLEAQTGGRSWIERLLPWTRERGDN